MRQAVHGDDSRDSHTHKSSDRPNGMGCMDENGGMNHNIHRQIKTFKSVKSKGKRKLIHTHTSECDRHRHQNRGIIMSPLLAIKLA